MFSVFDRLSHGYGWTSEHYNIELTDFTLRIEVTDVELTVMCLGIATQTGSTFKLGQNFAYRLKITLMHDR